MIGEPRCSLLLGTPGKGDPLAHARITLACLALRTERETPEGKRIRSRFLRRNPKSTLSADFPDFSFFRLEPQGASLNGGFGKAFELSREDLLLAGDAVEALGEREEGAVEHMNEDHRDAIELYARMLGKAPTTGWTLSGLDLEGLDLVNGDDVLRIPFAPPLASAEELRMRLVGMAKACRSAM